MAKISECQSEMESTIEPDLIAKINSFIKLADSFTSLKSISNNNEAVWNEIIRRPITDGGRTVDRMEREIQALRKDMVTQRKPLEDCGGNLALLMEKAGLDSTVVFTTLQKSRICLSDYVDWWRYSGKPQMQRIATRISAIPSLVGPNATQGGDERRVTLETSSQNALEREQLILLIRQQIKAESKTNLIDDVYVAAYRQCGSFRAAAAFLSEQTGRKIGKDKVRRAVERCGGVEAVLRTKDSESIQRTVASQYRDRKMKFASPMQPLEID